MTTETRALTADRFGVEIRGRVDFEDWVELFNELLDDKERAAWGIGDMIRYAEETNAFGDDYASVLSGGRMSPGGLANRVSICRRFPRDKRLWNLSISHYEAVRTLTDDKAFALLEQAEAMDMDRDALREEVKRVKGQETPAVFAVDLAWDAARGVFVPAVAPPTWIAAGQVFSVKLKNAA